MTKAEMNRRIAEMNPHKFAIVRRAIINSSYTPKELSDLVRVRLAHVNAVFKAVDLEIDAEIAKGLGLK